MNNETIVTYSQYNEDIILLSLLDGIEKGSYIDIGANYEEVDSVTKLFYDRGWRGINVEPIKNLYEELQKKRPEDTNLNVGVGEKTETAEFREYENLSGHSTFNTEQKKAHAKSKYIDYSVPIITLNDIYKKYKPGKVHFLKVDVEGFEYGVIAGNDWKKNRPEVLCIEANHSNRNWSSILTKNKYNLIIKDGLNEYYLADESSLRLDNYIEKAVQNRYNSLQKHQYDSWNDDLTKLAEARKRITALEKERYDNALSLRDVSLIRRLKRVAYGLTIDLYRYYKKKK